MKILGTEPTKWLRQIMCKHCKAYLEIGPDDVGVYYREGHDRYAVECAKCKKSIDIVKTGIPSFVKEKALKRFFELRRLYSD